MSDPASVKNANSLGILQDRRPVAEIVQDYDDLKRARYHLQRVIADMLVDMSSNNYQGTGKKNKTGARLAWCGKRPVPKKRALVVYEPVTDSLYKKNMMLCGLVWACPVCSARITGARRQELSAVIGGWQGSVLMGAFTVGHHAGDELVITKKIIDGACRSLFSGRAGQAVKAGFGVKGTISANEVTWSAENGWHPHRHILFVADRLLSKDEVSAFTDQISARFKALVEKHHGYTGDRAVHVTQGKDRQELLDYFFKWGVADELLSFQVKGTKDKDHLTPFELADRYGATGDQRCKVLFREYINAFRGSRRATYSRGLMDELGFKEKTDQALLNDAEAVKVTDAVDLPQDTKEVLVVADFTDQAVKDISVADKWDDVMGVFRRAVHRELTAMQVGIIFAFMGLRVMLYQNGAMGVYSMGESPPMPSPETQARIEKVNIYWRPLDYSDQAGGGSPDNR